MNIIETCNFFNEKFERLDSSLLVKFIEEHGFQINFDFRTNDLQSTAIVPELDFIESYILNLRFFIQHKDSISLSNMAKLYQNQCSDIKLKERFDEVHHIINSELDKLCPFYINTSTVTYREVFEGMIYAHFAHRNEAERHRTFIAMKEHRWGYYLALDTFVRCLSMFHGNLAVINQLNKEAFF